MNSVARGEQELEVARGAFAAQRRDLENKLEAMMSAASEARTDAERLRAMLADEAALLEHRQYDVAQQEHALEEAAVAHEKAVQEHAQLWDELLIREEQVKLAVE